MGFFHQRIIAKVFLLLVLVFLFPQVGQAGNKTNFFAMPQGEISNDDTHLVLARLLSMLDDRLQEAAAEYQLFLDTNPGNYQVRLELARLLLRQDRTAEASRQLELILTQAQGKESLPADELAAVLVEQGTVEARLGHVENCRQMFQKALLLTSNSEEIQLSLAEQMNTWGDFNRIKTIYRDYLARHPGDNQVRLKLANVLASSQRFEEAEGIYRLLLHEKILPAEPLLLGLANIRLQENNLPGAVVAVDDLLAYPADTRNTAYDLDILSEEKNGFLHIILTTAVPLQGTSIMTLQDQERLVIDLAGIEIHQDQTEWQINRAGIERIRLGRHQDKTRIVAEFSPVNLQEPLVLAFSKGLHLIFKVRPESSPDSLSNLFAGLRLKSEALLRLQRYGEALQIYTLISTMDSGISPGLIGQGKVFTQLDNKEMADKAYNQLLQRSPDNLEARFSLAVPGSKKPDVFLDDLLKTGTTLSVVPLVDTGMLYGGQGLYPLAIASFRAALSKDPQSFPALLGLIEALAADQQFDEAIALLNTMIESFPDNPKIDITMARILAWSRHYDEAINVYDRLHALHPANPVLLREKARTAVWGKKMAEAQAAYQSLWEDSVDRQLSAKITAIDRHDSDEFSQALARLNKTVDTESIYTGYEQVAAEVDTIRSRLDNEQANLIQRLVLELQPAYRIQKSAVLESRAKKFSWDKRFTPSMTTYEELLDFQPGNQEALFDYAQVQCSLGLCDREKSSYENLLRINPWHSLAKTALARQQNRSNPSIEMHTNYWEEEGRGELSQIARHRTELVVDLPVFCRYHLRVHGLQWLEEPKQQGGHYAADGQTIEINGVVNPYLSGALAWTGKDYSRDAVPDSETGYGRLVLNLRDYARLNAGFERTDELYNDFGIRHGTQADAWSLGLQSFLTRRLEVRGNARFLDYNDSNQGRHYSMAASYDVTDHPRIFKVTLAGESRDTEHKNIFTYQNTTLADITYPYWTPQNYTGGTIIFDWYHDLSRDFFCGAEQHFYDIRLAFGTNSESNPSAQLEAEWYYEFYHHWLIHIQGMAHGSAEWDALGFWTTLRYRF